MAISVVINTYNEAEKLPGCLESVRQLADEIVIVDMGSSDETLKIAEKFKAKIYHHEFLPYVEPARNFGLEKATGDWILVLDPDERMTRDLAVKLQEIAKDNVYDAANIPRKNIIFGRFIKHTNWWPDKHVRFFKKGNVSWSERIHQYPQVSGKILDLPAEGKLAIEHLNYDSVNQFLERQNRYSEIAAQNRFGDGERFSWKNFLWKPIRVFLQRYFRHAGFLDGFYGLALSCLASYSQLAEEVKLWEKYHAK